MKTFKRALSCFLALLMIFGSFSVLSYAALGDGNQNSVEVYTKFFVNGEEKTEVKAGDTVKVRIYVATDFVAATTTLFYVYPTNFMEFDRTGLTSLGGNGYDVAGVLNKSATSLAVTNNLNGLFNHEEGVVIDSESDADNLIYNGFLTEEYFDDKGWISFTIDGGIPVQYKADNGNADTEDDHLAEFTFKVKADATGEGYFHVVEESLKKPTAKRAFTAVMRAASDTSFTTVAAENASRLLYDFSLNDTNTIKLAPAEKYAVTYEYTGDIPTGYDEPEAIEVEEGTAITYPDNITAPDGYELTWSMTGDVDGKMGTAPVTVTGTWSKIKYDVTYTFSNEGPEGVDVPAAEQTTVGATINPGITAPAGWTFRWDVTGATSNGDGTFTAGANKVEFVGTWTKIAYNVTYSFANEGPEGVDAPADDTASAGDVITPEVTAPEGWAITWTATGATDNGNGTFTAGANDVEFVGTWSKNSYTITYYLTEQDQADGKAYDTQTIVFGEAITPIADPKVDGKVFDTWDLDFPTAMPAENLEAVAIFSDIVVTFYDVWGDPIDAYTMEVVTEITDADLPTEDDATAGEIVNFIEWQIDGVALETPYTLEDSVDVYAYCTVDIVYYADEEMSTKQGTLTFDFGDFITEEDVASVGEPEKFGHYFECWDIDFVGSDAIENSTVLPVFAPDNYEAEFMVDGEVYETKEATFGKEIAAPATAPTAKEGYTFKGWTDVEGGTTALDKLVMDAEGKIFYPVFTENGKADYTVEIYLMDETGKYGAPEEETGSATFGTTVTVDHADYAQDEWFSADLDEANKFTAVVAEDGSTVLKLYYKRAQYDVVIDGAAAVPVYHGATVTAPTTSANTPAGYELASWNDGEYAMGEVITVTEALTLEPDFTAGTSTYTVKTYTMGLDGEYGDADITTGTYTTDETVTYTAPVLEGFKADKDSYSVKVTGDGLAVIEVYYVRNQYDVVIDGAAAVPVYHGATVTAPTTSANTPAGYELASWNDGDYAKGEVITVTAPLTLTPDFTAGTSDYTVEIYHMNEKGEYALAYTDVLEGTTDTTATAAYADYAPAETYYSADTAAEGTVTETTITADGKATLKLYFKRAAYKVTVDDVDMGEVLHGATFTAPTTSTTTKAGYELESWNDGAYAKGEVITVTSALNLVAKNVAVKNTYNVEIYLMGTNGLYPTVPSATDKLEGETDTIVTAAHADYPQEAWFTPATDGNITSVTVTADGKATLKLYFKRAAYKVTVDGVDNGEVYHGATFTAPSVSTTTEPGYILESWNDGDYAKGEVITVTSALNLVAKNVAVGSAYTVEVYLMGTDGKYPATASTTATKSGTTGTKVTAAYADYAPAETYYSADTTAEGTITETTITGDGKATLKLYFARAQYDVTIDGVTTQVFHGATINAPMTTTATAPAGHTFAGWNGGTIAAGAPITVTGTLTLEPYFAAGAADYTVEIYLQKADGTYDAVASDTKVATGTTGESVTITHADYAQDAKYYLADDAQANVFTGTIAGDGSLVLKLYFKRAMYTVAYEYEDGTAIGTETEVRYGDAITAPAYELPEGSTYLGWFEKGTNNKMPETMPAKDVTYVVKFASGGEAPYTIEFYIMEIDGEYIKTTTSFIGKVGTIQEITPDYDREGFTVNTEKSVLSAEIKADGSTVFCVYYDRNTYTATFDNVDYTLYYGEALPTVVPAAQTGKEFVEWTPKVPAKMPAKDLVFTSVWSDVKYKLVYVIDGIEETYEYVAGQAITPIADPVVSGKKFVKWNKEIPAVMPAEDVYIVAVLENATYEVTFLDADGNPFEVIEVEYGKTITLPTTTPTKEFHVFKGWVDVPEKMPAGNITIGPEFERLPVRLVAAKGSTTIIDRDTMIITGLTDKMNDALAKNYLAVEGDGFYKLVPVEGFTGFYGTGAKVLVYDNADPSEPIEEFYIVIYGDLNGDSAVNSVDGSIVEDEVLYVTSWSRGEDKDALKVMAADLNKDGKIKPSDVDGIVNYGLGIVDIDQTTGKVTR